MQSTERQGKDRFTHPPSPSPTHNYTAIQFALYKDIDVSETARNFSSILPYRTADTGQA